MPVDGRRVSEVKVKGKSKAFTAEDGEGKAIRSSEIGSLRQDFRRQGSMDEMFRPKCTFRR
jgi:hypothetical protein